MYKVGLKYCVCVLTNVYKLMFLNFILVGVIVNTLKILLSDREIIPACVYLGLARKVKLPASDGTN